MTTAFLCFILLTEGSEQPSPASDPPQANSDSEFLLLSSEGFPVNAAVSVTRFVSPSGRERVTLRVGDEVVFSTSLPFFAVVTPEGLVQQTTAPGITECEIVHFCRGNDIGTIDLLGDSHSWSLYEPYETIGTDDSEEIHETDNRALTRVFLDADNSIPRNTEYLFYLSQHTRLGRTAFVNVSSSCITPRLYRVFDRTDRLTLADISLDTTTSLYGVDVDFEEAVAEGNYAEIGQNEELCGIDLDDQNRAIVEAVLPVSAREGDALLVYDGTTLFVLDPAAPFVWTIPVKPPASEDAAPRPAAETDD